MSEYSPKEYWSEVAARFRYADAAGFAPVLHPGAPDWFNRAIDSMQNRAVRRALQMAAVRPGAEILDVGCGSGRWLRRYAELGFHPTGLDATPGMLDLARRRKTSAPLLSGEADHLPIADSSFDCVSDVTVVQHLPISRQEAALAEMLRVLRPQGALILLELIRGSGAHIFPRSSQGWIQQVQGLGGKLVGWFGQEFLLLDRALTGVVQFFLDSKQAAGGPVKTRAETTARDSQARRVYWGIRRATVRFAEWFDPVAEKFLPGGIATHGFFVFRK
jgi:SAM-dependent methyltransferase